MFAVNDAHVEAGSVDDVDQLLIALAELPQHSYYHTMSTAREIVVAWYCDCDPARPLWMLARLGRDAIATMLATREMPEASGFPTPHQFCVGLGWTQTDPQSPWFPFSWERMLDEITTKIGGADAAPR